MKTFIKKQSLGLLFSCLTLVLIIVAAVMYYANGKSTYYNDYRSAILMYTLLAAVVTILPVVLTRLFGEKQIFDILYVAVPIILAVAVTIFIGLRVESFGIILGSDLESGNTEALGACNQAIITIVVYMLAMVSGMVTGFFRQVKPAEKLQIVSE